MLMRKNLALIDSRVSNALDVSSSSKSPSVGAKKAKRLRSASGPKGAKKPNEGSSSGNDNVGVNSA